MVTVTQLGRYAESWLPLLRRRLPVVAATTLAALAAALVFERGRSSEYRARAPIRVMDRLSIGSFPGMPGFDDDLTIVARARLLRSRTLARAVVAAEGMRLQQDRRPTDGLLERLGAPPWLRAWSRSPPSGG